MLCSITPCECRAPSSPRCLQGCTWTGSWDCVRLESALSERRGASNPGPSEGGSRCLLVLCLASAWLHSRGTERSSGSGKEKGTYGV